MSFGHGSLKAWDNLQNVGHKNWSPVILIRKTWFKYWQKTSHETVEAVILLQYFHSKMKKETAKFNSQRNSKSRMITLPVLACPPLQVYFCKAQMPCFEYERLSLWVHSVAK